MEAAVTSFIVYFTELFAAAALCFYVTRNSLKLPKAAVILATLAFCAVYGLLCAQLTQSPLHTAIVVFSALLPGSVFFLRVVNEKPGKLLFILLLVAAFAYLCNALRTLFYLLLQWDFDADWVYQDILTLAPFFVLTPPFAAYMEKVWRDIRKLEFVSWGRACVIPSLFLCFYILTLMLWQSNIISSTTRGVMDIVISACALLNSWQMLALLTKTSEATRYAEQLQGIDRLLAQQENRALDLEKHATEIKQLQHDMRHHFAALRDMLQSEQYALAGQYLRQYEEESKAADTPVTYCEHYAVDAQIKRFCAQAAQAGIRTDIAAGMPTSVAIKDVDLSIILGNLWENAMEACQRMPRGDRFIHLRIKTTNESVMIAMRNSYGGMIRKRQESFLSSKRKYLSEGIGIGSIQAVAKKYDGMALFAYTPQVFESSVLLYMPKCDPAEKSDR